MKFEFRIPILPRPSFFSNVKLAALSLAKLGGSYATAPLKVSIGDCEDVSEAQAVNLWAADYPVEWRPASDETLPGGAAVLERYAYEAEAEVVILMDADACLVRPIDDLVFRLTNAAQPTVAGVAAHFPPFTEWSTSEAQWRALLTAEGFPRAGLDFGYSIAPSELAGCCPPYFNYGFVAFNSAAFERVRLLAAAHTKRLAVRLAGTRESFFTAQIALTLGILDAGVEAIRLGPEFNCTNSDEMMEHGIANLGDIRVLHYLRTEAFNRHAFLCERKSFEAFRSACFASPVVRLLQHHVLSMRDVFLEPRHPEAGPERDATIATGSRPVEEQ